MDCEICGKPDANIKAMIEGTEFTVCHTCSRFGKIISVQRQKGFVPKRTFIPREKLQETEEKIIENYGEIIKRSREKLGLSQEDFAKKINEKISLVHKLETSTFEPPIAMAKKIEKFLRIKLVDVVENSSEKGEKIKKTDGLTIGDVIKNIKTRK